jgi:hypothetical protein
MRVTAGFFGVAVAAVAGCAWAGVTQSSSFVLREEVPRSYWPQSNTVLVSSHIRGRGAVFHAGRAEWGDFSGGGPGRGGK